MAMAARPQGAAASAAKSQTAAMDRRGFLCAGVAAALAIPVPGITTRAPATGSGDQAAVVLVLIGVDPDTGVAGWVDTDDGGRYDLADGVATIPGTVGRHLGATVYRDGGHGARPDQVRFEHLSGTLGLRELPLGDRRPGGGRWDAQRYELMAPTDPRTVTVISTIQYTTFYYG